MGRRVRPTKAEARRQTDGGDSGVDQMVVMAPNPVRLNADRRATGQVESLIVWSYCMPIESASWSNRTIDKFCYANTGEPNESRLFQRVIVMPDV